MDADTRRSPFCERRILVVADDPALSRSLEQRIQKEGGESRSADSIAAARKTLAEERLDLVVLDQRIPFGPESSLIDPRKGSGAAPVAAVPTVVMITPGAPSNDAIDALKAGAYGCLRKPIDLDEFALVAGRILENLSIRGEWQRLRAHERSESGIENLVGQSAATEDLRSRIRSAAASGARTMLITGPAGSGKDLVARAIHVASSTCDRPFVSATCTTSTEALLECELFGHEPGAFVEATTRTIGLIEEADGGTVYLDEIGDLPASLQARLLRVLETKTLQRVGGASSIAVDVRIIAATRRPLPELIKSGKFRSDLYDRLNVLPIELQPLAQRREDILPLVDHYTRHYARELRREVTGFDDDARDRLLRYGWPGNVRELRNCVERAVLRWTILNVGSNLGPTLGVADLPSELRAAPVAAGTDASGGFPADTTSPTFELPANGVVIDEVCKSLLDQALVRTKGNKSRAAELLGIHRDQVRYWVKKYQLERWIRRRRPWMDGVVAPK